MRRALIFILALAASTLVFQACQKQIEAEQSNEMDSVHSHFEQLKGLNWLAGNWEDKDDTIDVKYTVAWDKNKNFLTQNFILSIPGQDELSGMQIIGWDPIEKQIRSWIFDSDGGYGKSVWFATKVIPGTLR